MNSYIQKTKLEDSKFYRDQLFKISDKAATLSKALDEATVSLGSITIGLCLSTPSEFEKNLNSNSTEQLLRMVRTSTDLKKLGNLRTELESGQLGPYFELRNPGDNTDLALQIWIEEIWDYLVKEANVKPTVSREAGNSALIEMALQKLKPEISASKIYSRIRKIKKIMSETNL